MGDKEQQIVQQAIAWLQAGNGQSPEARAFLDNYCEGTYSRTAPLIFKKAIPDDLQPCQALGIRTVLVMLPAINFEDIEHEF